MFACSFAVAVVLFSASVNAAVPCHCPNMKYNVSRVIPEIEPPTVNTRVWGRMSSVYTTFEKVIQEGLAIVSFCSRIL